MKNIGRIIFIGAGKMASAIAGGMVKNGFNADNISAYDVNSSAVESFTTTTGVAASTEHPERMVKEADIVIIAVKPQVIKSALAELLLAEKTIISIAAGITIKLLAKISGSSKIIRVMPNTPALVGQGVSAWCASADITETEADAVKLILSAVGKVCRVDEKMMDAVTGLSGSGPAYVFDFIQALADGGVKAGLPRDTALMLAGQTVAGAAAMMIESGEHPAVLRDMVTSPGGTTAAALAVLERRAFKGIVSDAVNTAAARSAELGK
ncbi:MAG: pyrroline-5-carboxylate reductase [Victivallaceae bacterium]|nr:pyrroline-5-carboxylate reductase [Victivallaceae bacterium]